MKKLLLLAALVVGTLSAWAYDQISLSSPVTALTDGGYYYFYDAMNDDGTTTEVAQGSSSRYGFLYPNTSNVLSLTHVKPATEVGAATKQLTNRHVWKAVQDGSNWKFQNVDNSQWFSNANNTSATAASFTLETTATTATFSVKCVGKTDKPYWNADPGRFNYWSNPHPIRFYAATLDATGYHLGDGKWNVTYTFPDGTTETKLLLDGANAAEHITPNPYVTLGLSETNTTISETNKSFHVVITAPNYPFRVSESVDNLIWQPLYLHATTGYAMIYDAANATSNVKCDLSPGVRGCSDDALWAFVGDLYNGFRVYNKAATNAKALKAGTTFAAIDDAANATVWKMTVPDAGATSGTRRIFSFKAQFGTANEYINYQSGFPKHWRGADAGSSLWSAALAQPLINFVNATFPDKTVVTGLPEAYEACVADPWDETKFLALRTMVTNLGGLMGIERSKGNALVNLGFFSELAVARWRAASAEKADYTADDITAIKNAYHALIHSTCSPDSLLQPGHHIRIKHAGNKPGAYIGWNGTADLTSVTTNTANANTSAFKVIPASAGGFKLYNEASNKYLKYDRRDNQLQQLVANESEATVLVLEPFAENKTAANIQIRAKDLTDANNRLYLHTNGNVNLVTWGPALNSSWYLEGCEPVVAAKENLRAAINSFSAIVPIGTGVGQYRDECLASVRALLTNDAATEAEVRAPIAALRAGTYNVASYVNMPVPGHFYRFKGVESTRYMGSYNDSSNKIPLLANKTGANEPLTIFYLDAQNRIVAYPSGYVIGQFLSSVNPGSWKFLRADNTYASAGVTFTAVSGQFGKFIISPSTGRNIYSGNSTTYANVNCGNGTSSDYQWIIEDVEWLPVNCDANGIASFYTPVELKLNEGYGAGRFTAYSVNEVLPNGSVVLNQLTTAVPANTPVVMVRNGSDNFLEINYAAPTAAPATNALAGNIHAAAKANGTNYLMASKVDNKNTIAPMTAAEVPGFSAHIDLTTTPAAKYRCYTGPFVPGKLYSITSTDGRGSLIHRPENGNAIWTTGKASIALDNNNKNHLWTLYVDNNDSTYLVNAGLKKFAYAYESPCTQNTNVRTNWGFSDLGSAIRLPEASLTNVRILGGDYNAAAATTPTAPGMMIINGWAQPVPCISGVNNPNDGNHFNFAAVGNVTAEDWSEIETLYANQATVLANALTYPYESCTAASGDEPAFGEYPSSVKDAFQAALPSTSLTLDRQYRDAPTAQAAATTAAAATPRSSFENGQLYEISDATGSFHFQIVKGCTSDVVTSALLADNVADANLYKWYAEVTDGTVAFYQNWDRSIFYVGGTGKRYFNYPAAGDNRFSVTLHPTAGSKAALTPVSAAAPAAADEAGIAAQSEPTYFEIAKVTAPTDGSITTAIVDLNADSAADAATCYDLQGRRIARPAHGLYIQGGRKLIR